MAIRNDRIPIEKKNIPYRFAIALPRTEYELEVRYNKTADLFTIGLYKSGTLICIEPVIYGAVLFEQMYQPREYPALRIVPCDNSGGSASVTWNNFGETVFLEVVNSNEQ